ncbi:AAA family ATPase [bacterium]|jgi:putative ATP-dependent endonuclease of the OLD family|nr:AAA family ATPase [bacterium]MBT4495494.1 AAA family ATPase [bacterium]MBT4764306.1 AAA family ATPase [bacterium]MBT5401677.1 AAA family ATPase [bacterium]MBT5942148.1 AAA family ATPase [bacterium]
MKISKIRIQNYRSIESCEIILDDFNVFVGQNNHGKTNFFEAIDWFYKAKKSPDNIKFKQESDREILVEIDYVDIQSGLDVMKNKKNETTIKKVLEDVNTVTIKKSSIDHKRVFIINDEEKTTGAGFDNALNDFLPFLEYVNTKIRLEDVSVYKSTTPISKMLSGVLSAIIEENPEYAKFREKFSDLFSGEDSDVRAELNKLGDKVEIYLQKQFPDGTKIEFNVIDPIFEDLLKNFETTVDDGVKTSAQEKGDGMQRAIMLSIIQAYADFRKDQQVGKQFLFMIDEAELHLHPSGQRALKRALLDVASEGDQVLLNTHSSVLVADEEDIQNIFEVVKKNKKTEIKKIDQDEKMGVVYELLGGSPADLLFPKNFLIVEGRSEYIFLTKIISRFYPEKKGNIQISFAGGDTEEQRRNIEAIHKMYNPLAISDNPIYKDRTIIICDKPIDKRSENKLEEFRKHYPYLVRNNQLFELDVTSLEEYYPGEWKKTYEESRNLGKDAKKTSYAEEVANKITKEQFENEMPVLYEALKKCWDLSY